MNLGNKIMSISLEDYASYSSILGLILSVWILIKSHSIKREVDKVRNQFVLKKRIPKILKSLNEKLSLLNRHFINVEENDNAIKGTLIECQSILSNIASKIEDGEIKDRLSKTESKIEMAKKKRILSHPPKYRVFKEFMATIYLYPFIYSYNLQSIKNDLDRIYNDLMQISLDQKEL